ncbi:hypothetical protein YC2023_032919 [Brassica napus]
MKKEADDYIYRNESGFKNVVWKMSEISWKKFQYFNKAEGIVTELRLIWYKETSEEMKNINYVFEDVNGDISELCSSARIASAIDPPKEDDDPEESEDEADTTKNKGDDLKEMQTRDGDLNEKQDHGADLKETQARADDLKEMQAHGDDLQNKGVRNLVNDGDEVILDAGNGGDDNRFQSLFEEGTRRSPKLNEVTRTLAAEQAKEERDEEESDPEFGLEDVQYPDTPLSSDEEWEQWKNPKREKGKEKFHGDFDKEPYIWLFQKFNSGLEFKDQLLRYSLNTQYDVKMAKSEATRIAAICCKSDCHWRIYCSVERPLNKWMVKVCHNKHNHGKSSRVSMLKQGVIAVLEAQTIQFGKLWDYEAELKRSNKDITTEICTADVNGGIIHAIAAELPKAEHPIMKGNIRIK